MLLAGSYRSGAALRDEGLEWEARGAGRGATSPSPRSSPAAGWCWPTAIVPWAHWVTPALEERRYDTRFFVAALPAGQETAYIAGEADRSAWWRPSDALAAGGRRPEGDAAADDGDARLARAS